MSEIVVVGAGQAGAALVARLRGAGFDGGITLIGEEPVPPYQRPPLSKAYLLGDMPLERLFLRPESYYAEQDIRLLTDSRVSAIDPAAKTVALDSGSIGYDQLALTTGSVPRMLPESAGGLLGGVYPVRTLADVDAMAPKFLKGASALVVGGGYIGLEAAAAAAKRGLDVTVVEVADRILQRVAARETSSYIRNLHRAHGVDIRERIGIQRLVGNTSVEFAELSDGSRIRADLVVIGVGIVPNTELAAAAGLEIDNGIKTDALGRTSVPGIWAAGDCTSFPYRGDRIRLESVQNAIDQAETVAVNMLGHETPYDPTPWFWSDQYDLKLQIAGLNTGHTEIVSRISDDGSRASYWYFGKNRLLAVDAMNDPISYMVGRRLIEAGKTPNRETISDPKSNLKALLR
ncbi:MAG: FAD-dependent oxidoreductase [Rhodobacteraceae bacterium]|nr:FAD-dependent oxidoreductase [Paracoccaceae bacterium]MCY4139152.1 FAD-dependent oxidoreductase [Paracoccaceae bacterium]